MKLAYLLLVFAFLSMAISCKQPEKATEYVSMKNAPFIGNDSLAIYYSTGFEKDSAWLLLNDKTLHSYLLSTDYSDGVAAVTELVLRKTDTLTFKCKGYSLALERKDRYAFVTLSNTGLEVTYTNYVGGLD